MNPRPAADALGGMIRDLRSILDGWEYEPGKISVRRIMGRDGREKLQTRIDLGVMQLECRGRPDGQRPEGFESLLDVHEHRLREHIERYGDDEEFALTPEDCRDLRHEAYLYYQRYLAYFVLEEYDGVERDTARNLRVIEFCARYAASDRDRRALLRQRPYVVMMHTRARVHLAIAAKRPAEGLRQIDAAIHTLQALEPEGEPACAEEIGALRGLRQEVLQSMPPDAPARLRAELELALAREDYELAARLRDQLRIPKPAGNAAPA